MTPEDKLFHASVAAMQGILASGNANFLHYEYIAEYSVNHAESLLAELDKEGGE